MRRLAVLFLLFAVALPALAEDWTTNDGRTYKDVTVVGQEEDGVRINYDGGVGKVFYSDMPLNLQKRFGQDPATLAAKKKAADQVLAQQAAAAAAEAAKLKAAQQAAGPGTAATPGTAAGQHPAQPSASSKPVVKTPHPATQPSYTPGNHPSYSAAPNNPYPGAKYSYDPTADKSYLDSFNIELEPQSGANGDIGAVVLRIATDGRTPQMPEQMEAVFVSPGNPARVINVHDVTMVVDGKSTPLTATPKKDISVVPFASPGYSSLDLTTDQARSFRSSSGVEIHVGSTVYKVTSAGASAAEDYFITFGKLPPASTGIVKMFHKFIAGIPSFATMISALCGYVFLGAFGIFITAFVVLMIIGIVRLINV